MRHHYNALTLDHTGMNLWVAPRSFRKWLFYTDGGLVSPCTVCEAFHT